MPNELLNAALKLAANGIPVFPCHPKTKHPLPPADRNSEGKKIQGTGGHKKATTDLKQITTWWTQWPGAAIGTPTGRPETGNVCDIDNKNEKNGFAAVPDWESLTPMIVSTPNDGRHLWFRYDGSLRSTSSQIAPGVDTRGDDAYVLVPPSPGYRFVKGNFSSLASLPSWPQKYRLPEREATQEHVSGAATAPIEHIAAAVQHIPNNDLDWERWNEIGMAIFRATSGDSEGFAVFDTWSQKSTKYDFDHCLARWEHWGSSSPPTKIGAGTLFHLADKVSAVWREDPRVKTAAVDEFSEVPDAYDTQRPEDQHGGLHATPFAWIDPAKIPTRKWLYDRHYVRQFVSATVAPGGVGKSSLALVEALAMTTGKPLLGVTPNEVCRVWYWCGEDPLDEIIRRVAAACLHYSITPDDIGGRLFLDSGREQQIIIGATNRNGLTIAKPVVQAVADAIRERAIDVMTVDPFVSSHRVMENDNSAIDAVVKEWCRISEHTKTAIELVHHVRKTGGQEVTFEDGRGAIAFGAAVRSGRVLNSMSRDEAEKAGIDNPYRFFRIGSGKANMAPRSDRATWRELVSVPLGNGVEGGAGDFVGVVRKWQWPDPMDGLEPGAFDKVATVIRGGVWREDSRARDWAGIGIADALGLDLSEARDRARVASMLKSWIDSKALVVVERLDAKRMPKRFVEVGDCDFF